MPFLFAIGFICLIIFALVFDDGLDYILDTFEEISANVRFATKFVVSRARRYGRMVRNVAIGLGITYVIGLVGLILAIIVQSTAAVIGISILLTLIAATFFVVLNWVMIAAKRSGAGMLATLTLLPLPVILWAAGAPFHFYEWFLTAYGGLMIVGFAFLILGRLINSKIFLGPYVITAIVLISGIGFALTYAFPQQARAMVIGWKTSNRDTGRDNLAKEVALRKKDTFRADAHWWKVSTDSAGRTIQKRYVDVIGNQCMSKSGQEFKTVLAPADSTENGSTYIQAYYADQKTGEYVFLDIEERKLLKTDTRINMGTKDNPCLIEVTGKESLEEILPWVDASKTTSTAKVFDKTKAEDPEAPSNSAWDGVSVTNLSMTATGFFSTGIHLKKGQQVRIHATGTVNSSGEATANDGAYKWVGPDGWQSDPSFNSGRRGPLAAGQSFMALAGRITNGNPSTSDGNWTLVGSDRVLTAQEDGELKLVANDKAADSKGARPDWPANNQGGFQLQIQVK